MDWVWTLLLIFTPLSFISPFLYFSLASPGSQPATELMEGRNLTRQQNSTAHRKPSTPTEHEERRDERKRERESKSESKTDKDREEEEEGNTRGVGERERESLKGRWRTTKIEEQGKQARN